jgi:hypothetical protein
LKMAWTYKWKAMLKNDIRKRQRWCPYNGTKTGDVSMHQQNDKSEC